MNMSQDLTTGNTKRTQRVSRASLRSEVEVVFEVPTRSKPARLPSSFLPCSSVIANYLTNWPAWFIICGLVFFWTSNDQRTRWLLRRKAHYKIVLDSKRPVQKTPVSTTSNDKSAILAGLGERGLDTPTTILHIHPCLLS